ncbi:MAG: type III secretion system chaperone [Alphaproteobacteria bacterium]|nr:type III secretion system chaperone [Alphaproteobacteria bacterium]
MQRRIPLFQALFLTWSIFIPSVATIASAQDAEPTPLEEAEPESAPDAEDAPPTVTAAIDLLTVVTMIDEDASITSNGATFEVDGTPVTLVFDVNADRMRLFTRVASSDGLSGAQLKRLMQANFDTALDARYAIAGGQVWSTFMHPLVSLSQDDFVSAIAQTVTLVRTYGTTFSSGALSFGAGDSNAEIQKLLEGPLDGETDI